MANKKKKVQAKAKPKVKAKPKGKIKPAAKTKAQAKTKAKPAPKAKAKNVAAKPVVKAKPPVTKAAPVKKIDYTKAITPLGDRLVVRVGSAERVTAGGLIIPDTVSQATGFLKATVLAIGRGSQNKKGSIKPMDVQVGDSVLFSQHSGMKIKFNSEDLQIIQETDVMGVVQN